MYNLKGFATHASLSNNTPGIVAPYGEISTQSLTYSREKGLHKAAAAVDINLISFLSTTDGTFTAVSNTLVDHLADVMLFVYNKALNVSGEQFADILLQQLTEQFAISGSNFQCGAMIQSGTHWAPEWVSWTNINIPALGPNNLKIWLSDAAFQQQYDEYQIVVIPPITPLDNFFQSGAQVDAAIAALVPSTVMNTIQAAKAGYPETIIRAETFNYVDPLNPGHLVPTTWNVLIYGLAGNNIDSISDALADYILSHSTHERPDWVQILPDLFKRTEFVLIPFWNQYGIPDRALEAGIYSPAVQPLDALQLIKQVLPAYPGVHIDGNASIVSNPFKSLQMGVIGGAENRNNQFRLTDVFPDYLNVSTTSFDFGRMAQATQDWSYLLAQMLPIAETMTQYSPIPTTFTKIKRNGILYIAARFNNINYMVAAKSTLPELQIDPPQN